jgi:hypothetical protein
MRFIHLNVLSAALLVAMSMATAADAELQNLSGAEVREIVAGKTVFLETPYGVELPIRYRANGTMTGSGHKIANLVSANGKTVDRGRWWIKGNRLCQKWNDWLNGKSLCFRLKLEGKKVYWRANNGHQGTARIGG